MASQVVSMNWKSPRADDVNALAVGSNADSRAAVRRRKSKEVPVVRLAAWIAELMRSPAPLTLSRTIPVVPRPARPDRAKGRTAPPDHWVAMVKEALTSLDPGGDYDRAPPPQARRPLFRGFQGGRNHRAPAHPHGDRNGQHAVLEHDAQPAAAAHRPAFLPGDRVETAADELALHARADDRDFRQRHHRRHDDRQS